MHLLEHQARSIPNTLFLGVTRILKWLLRVGIPMGPMILRTMRERKSGKRHSCSEFAKQQIGMLGYTL